MNQKEIPLQAALNDLRDIRRVMERTEHGLGISLPALKTKLLLQCAATIVAAIFLGAELLSGSQTALLMYSAKNPIFRGMGLAFMGSILLALGAALYLVLWDGARREQEDFQAYVARNFIHLNALSFSSDLFVKFVATAMAIIALKPEWVGALLLIFTSDYLLQGRLFTLPTRIATSLGAACLLGGIVQFLLHSPDLTPALLAFTMVGTISIVHTRKQLEGIGAANEERQGE